MMSSTEQPPVEEHQGFHTIDEPDADSLDDDIPSPEDIESLASYFTLLGDPTRLRILLYLDQRELCVHDLTELMDMKQPAISHQLSNLREEGLVNRRKDGRVVYYSLANDQISDVIRGAL